MRRTLKSPSSPITTNTVSMLVAMICRVCRSPAAARASIERRGSTAVDHRRRRRRQFDEIADRRTIRRRDGALEEFRRRLRAEFFDAVVHEIAVAMLRDDAADAPVGGQRVAAPADAAQALQGIG